MLLHLPIGFFVLAVVVLLIKNQFKKKSFHKSYRFILGLTAISTVITALMGVALSREGGYDETILNRHLNYGVLLSISLGLLIAIAIPIQKSFPKAFYVLISTGFLLIIIVGHNGATLTHGENYVFAPMMGNDSKGIKADSLTAFGKAIAPVFEKKCSSCHNPKKKKGGLILTDEVNILKGGEDGMVIIPGKPWESEMIKRIHLNMDDEDHMPPSGKPQLSANEIHLLETWISQGAEFSKLWDSYPETDSFKIISNQVLRTYQKPKLKQYDFDFASNDKIKKLNTPFRNVSQLAVDVPAVKANFYLAQFYKSQYLKELSDIKSQLVELNLSGMPVEDDDIRFLSQFNNLEILNLNNTKITDQSIDRLVSLNKLSKLSLTGTKVTSKGMKKLSGMKSLQEVYLWNTPVNQKDVEALRGKSPTIIWNQGFVPDENEKLKLTSPILKNENFLVGNGDPIILKHNLPGTIIRYTLDGSSPDSTDGNSYSQPLNISNQTILKAIATKDGWLKSNELEYHFFTKGVKPIQAKLLSTPNKDYKAKGAATLIDDQLGDVDNYRDGNWLGFREAKFEATFNFEKSASVREITLIYNKNIGSYLMPPQQVEVWGGDNAANLQLLQTVKPEQPIKYEPNSVDAVILSVKGQYLNFKIVATTVSKLPAWHSGKGEKGWLMLTEVIFR